MKAEIDKTNRLAVAINKHKCFILCSFVILVIRASEARPRRERACGTTIRIVKIINRMFARDKTESMIAMRIVARLA